MAPRKKPAAEKPVVETPALAVTNEELLSDLLSEAPVEQTKGSGKKKSPIIYAETTEEKDILNAFGGSNEIFKLAKMGNGRAKDRAQEHFLARFLRLCVEAGHILPNPEVVSDATKARLEVRRKSTLTLSDKDPTPGQQLLGMGISKEIVDQIQDVVVKIKPTIGLKSFTTLNEGSGDEKAIAGKLMQFVKGLSAAQDGGESESEIADRLLDSIEVDGAAETAVLKKIKSLVKGLSPTERKLAIVTGKDVTVQDDWHDVAVRLARKAATDGTGKVDIDQAVRVLQMFFQAVPPVFALGHAFYTGKLADALKNLQLEQEAENEEKVITSGDGKFRAKVLGSKVTLFLVRPDGEERVGDKKCDDSGHAEATARKWFRVPTYLKEFMDEKGVEMPG